MRALAEVPGPLPDRGVVHVVIPHTDRFTVVGNHLAQHPGLSTTAVGFAVRIQSLPQGTEIGVKALAARFPEGEKLIAAALRELEAHGYLQRARTRLPNGRIVTRTVFCNQPAALLRARTAAFGRAVAALRPGAAPGSPVAPLRPSTAAPRQASGRQIPPPAPTLLPLPVPAVLPAAQLVPVLASVPPLAPALEPASQPPVPALTSAGQPAPAPASAPQPTPGSASAPAPAPAPAPTPPHHPQPPAVPPFVPLLPPPTAPKPPPRPLPQPHELTPELHQVATALLSDLRRHAPQFVLSENDVRQLAPGVAAWLERDAHPDAIRHALTNDPPQPLRHPAKLLKHRLTALLPPPLPGSHVLAASARRVAVTPFQTCDGCDRAFRSPAPGLCRDCRTEPARAAA